MSIIKVVILLFFSLVTAEALAIDSDGEDLTMMSMSDRALTRHVDSRYNPASH